MKYLILLLITFSAFAANEEAILQQECSKGNLPMCETLTAFYVKMEKWDNAYTLGEALCTREQMKGCTFAGTALLAKGRAKDGVTFLQKACDGFEPYACRSLARLMKQNKEEIASYMFTKRSCHYGLEQSCKNLKAPKETYSEKGKEFLKKTMESCDDTKSSLCKDAIASLAKCSEVYTTKDCQLLPGELSIFFRAKLLQESAKLVLMNLMADEAALKQKPQQTRFSYDLKTVMQNKDKYVFKYVFGFSKACTKKFEKGNAESTSLAIFKDAYSDMSDRTKKNIAAFFYKGKAEDCYDPKFSFEAFAVSNLDPQNTASLDIWKINNDGNLVQVQNGLPTP